VTRFRGTWVEVDLGAIRHNAVALKPADAELMAVVKADAYGHGDVEVATAALEAGATWLGVALVEEGLALRRAGVEAPILLMSEPPPGSEAVALAHRLTPTIASEPGLQRLVAVARGAIAVHVKLDTGMHRIGIWPPSEAPAFVARVAAAGLDVEGLWTHFARSEDDDDTTRRQLERFRDAVDGVRRAGVDPRILHAANSAAVLRHPESHLDLVRPGIALYGIEPAPGLGAGRDLRPALSWRSTVTATRRLAAGEGVSYGHRYVLERDAWIATAPVGYADGFPRAASSRAEVCVGDRRCRVAGTVTMDQLMVDCGDVEPAPGDEVTIVGGGGPTAAELAGHADTIAYEIVTRIGPRVPRGYVG
jgi:alanine racemase